MLHFQRWEVILVWGIVLGGFLLPLPELAVVTGSRLDTQYNPVGNGAGMKTKRHEDRKGSRKRLAHTLHRQDTHPGEHSRLEYHLAERNTYAENQVQRAPLRPVMLFDGPTATQPEYDRCQQSEKIGAARPVARFPPRIRIVQTQAPRDVLGEVDEPEQRPRQEGNRVESQDSQ